MLSPLSTSSVMVYPFSIWLLVLISVCTLCYGPGLLFRGPSCIISVASRLWARKQLRKCNKLVVLGDIECGITRMNGEHLGRKSGKYVSKVSSPSLRSGEVKRNGSGAGYPVNVKEVTLARGAQNISQGSQIWGTGTPAAVGLSLSCGDVISNPYRCMDISLVQIIIIFIYCNWVVTRWQWLCYMYTKHEIGY